MAHEHGISHVVGSLYTFSEMAGHELMSSFRKNSSCDASCHLNDRNIFTIHVSREDDEVLACLVNSIRNFISAEKNNEPDLFEDKKIIRISGTHPSSALAALPEKRVQAMRCDTEAPLIEHENIIRKWVPSTESKELGLEFIHLLGRIERLCGCRIEHANDSADMLLKADRVQDVEKGISKLKRLNKTMVDEIRFPYVYSFYILEGETSVSLQIVALKDLHDRRRISTLLPGDSPVKLLRDLCVLVLVKGSNILQVNLKPSALCQEYRLWNDHVYDCNHVQGLSAAKTPKESKTPIDKWVSEVTNTHTHVDAFLPESTAEIHESADIGMVYKELSSPTKKPITKRARASRGNTNLSNKAFIDFNNRHGDKEATVSENVTSFGDDQTMKSSSRGKGSESVRQPPNIEPPYMPPYAIPSDSLSKEPSRMSQQILPSSATWNVVVRSSKSGNLVDISVPNEGCARDEATVVAANVQDKSITAKTPVFKNMMNQRKAPTQAFVGGDTALVKTFEGIIASLLLSARPRTGRVGFTVDIGRLLINQQYASSEFKNRIFKTSEFSLVLPRGETTDFEPMFTNMLTARSAEAESILNVLMSQGRRLFQQQPISRRVTYQFTCQAKDGDQIIIEYDQNKEFNIRGSELLIGTLDWHFPKRAWDARLRLTSEHFLATDYQKQVKGIVENLKISVSGDGQSLQLWTRTIDDLLSIKSITLHRETLHPLTVYPDLLLQLTEYQDLSVRQLSENVYGGSVKISNVMVKANRLWWGAKISSINAKDILEENITLELGETAKWTPSDIIKKGVVGDLFAAAKEIVTHIDHVGFFNRGGGEGSSNAETNEKGSGNTQDISAGLRRVDPGFW